MHVWSHVFMVGTGKFVVFRHCARHGVSWLVGWFADAGGNVITGVKLDSGLCNVATWPQATN
jgi:hypothetical protein